MTIRYSLGIHTFAPCWLRCGVGFMLDGRLVLRVYNNMIFDLPRVVKSKCVRKCTEDIWQSPKTEIYL